MEFLLDFLLFFYIIVAAVFFFALDVTIKQKKGIHILYRLPTALLWPVFVIAAWLQKNNGAE